MPKGFPLILIVLAVAIGGYFVYQQQIKSTPVTPLDQTTTQPSPIPSPYKEDWQKYESGQNIDGITINYPKDWKVNYRKEYNLYSGDDAKYNPKYRLAFDFAPANLGYPCPDYASYMCWGIVSFDVYDRQVDINQYVSKYSPHDKKDLTIKEDTKIGGRPAFKVSTELSQYGATVIFGSDYTYDLGHSQDGSDDFARDFTTKTGIFQYIHIN